MRILSFERSVMQELTQHEWIPGVGFPFFGGELGKCWQSVGQTENRVAEERDCAVRVVCV